MASQGLYSLENAPVAAGSADSRMTCEIAAGLWVQRGAGTCSGHIHLHRRLAGKPNIDDACQTVMSTNRKQICKAAIHAGAIGRGGGDIAIVLGHGQRSYWGSARSGIPSESAEAQSKSSRRLVLRLLHQ